MGNVFLSFCADSVDRKGQQLVATDAFAPGGKMVMNHHQDPAEAVFPKHGHGVAAHMRGPTFGVHGTRSCCE